jgi:hypothetical protein
MCRIVRLGELAAMVPPAGARTLKDRRLFSASQHKHPQVTDRAVRDEIGLWSSV